MSDIATSDMATGNVEGMKALSEKFKELANIVSEEVLIQGALGVGRAMQKRMRQRIKSTKKSIAKKMHVKGETGFNKKMNLLSETMTYKKTGNLVKSIVVKKFKPGGANLAFVATDYKIAPHARPVEFGHGGPHPAPAHPFFRPVVDEFMHNGELEKELGKAVEKAIDKAVQ